MITQTINALTSDNNKVKELLSYSDCIRTACLDGCNVDVLMKYYAKIQIKCSTRRLANSIFNDIALKADLL